MAQTSAKPLRLNALIHEPAGDEAAGDEAAAPLLIAHGLYGSARNFNSLGKRLATDRRVVMVDMRNHGESPWAEDASYAAMAKDLALAIDAHCGGRAVVLGHSMGGKAAMGVALASHPRVAALCVVDIAPVAYGHSHMEILAAMEGLDLAGIARRSEADAALAGAIPDKGLRGFILQNLKIEGGAARWRINLGALKAGMAGLLDFPEIGERYPGPALFLHGTGSDYVTAEMHPAIHARFPNAEIEGIAGAGHWLHAERPEAFLAAVSAWLGRL